jgi:tetratricopeptide (TPR) repeat protein
MTSGLAERYDFFLSRGGSVAAIAREVTDVLLEKGYKVRVEDYDFRLGTSFIEEMHEAITRSRGLIILFTEDYLRLPYTRKEFTSFEAQRLRSPEERHVAILRCEDAPLEGLLADVAYQNLVGVVEPGERKRRIIAAAERQSQSAPPPPRPRPFMGVPPRIASFTGRAHDLTRLDAILMQERSAAVTQAVGRAAIQGMGGVGKTSLVVEYAHRYRKLYAGVCWCSAETRTGLLSALASLAVALGAARPEEADVDSAAKAALRRLAEQHATWLLIYDNVTAPDHVADLLPSAGARVLITSRFSDWGEVADEVALDVLPLEEAVALLQGRTARSDAAGARMLAEALGCLPLALDHAAAYCRRSQMRFAEAVVCSVLTKCEKVLGPEHPFTAESLNNLAVMRQSQGDYAAARPLFERALAIREKVLGPEHPRTADSLDNLGILLQTLGDPAGARPLHERALAIREKALGPEHPGTATSLNNLAKSLLLKGDLTGARPLYERALAIGGKTLAPEHPNTNRARSNLSRLLLMSGQPTEAFAASETALIAHDKVLGRDHRWTKDSARVTADALDALGRTEEAKALRERYGLTPPEKPQSS